MRRTVSVRGANSKISRHRRIPSGILTICLCTLLLLLLAAWPALAEEGPNLLQNPGFDSAQDGWPIGWEEDMWRYEAGTSFLEPRMPGRDGTGFCAYVENRQTNDARFIQKVQVEPGELYRLSGWVKAEGCDPAAAGASLSVVGSFRMFPEVFDTNSEWVELTCYLETDTDQRELLIGARLGDYGADTVGRAWFDDLSLVKVDAVPVGVTFIQLTDYSRQIQTETTPATNDKLDNPNRISPFFGVVVLAALLVALWCLRARGTLGGPLVIGAVLVVAALVRLYLMATRPGYATDMGCFLSWSLRMAEVGPSAFYAEGYFCDYPPGFLYLLWGVGGLLKLLNIDTLGTVGRVIVKLIPMLFDLGAVCAIWGLGRKRLGETAAVLLAALYALSPAVLMDGAIWGQVDAVLAFGLLVAVVWATEGRWRLAIPAFVLTVLMKPQALMAGPIGLVALVMALIADKEKKIWKDALLGMGISLLAATALLTPFLIGQEDPLGFILQKYGGSFSTYPHATVNAANLWYLIGANWVHLSQPFLTFTYGMLGTLLTVLTVVVVLALYIWRKDMDNLPFFGALMFIALFVFGIEMHERYLFPALVLLLYAYIRKPDRRLLALFIGYSLTFYLNCALVLRDTHLPLGFGWMGCALAVVNLLLFAVAIWVIVDPKPRTLPEARPIPPDDGKRVAALSGKTTAGFNLRKLDWLLMLGLTGVYAVVAYAGLGSTVAPQTVWRSTDYGEVIRVDLGSVREFNILYYAGINQIDSVLTFETSVDGESWTESSPSPLKIGDCFRWQYVRTAVYDANGDAREWRDDRIIFGARYVQIVMTRPGETLIEVVFRGLDGEVLPVHSIEQYGQGPDGGEDPALLFDEPDTVPDEPSYYNGMYFDEIYHGRTGYEHANALLTYENTHPPLGKVLIMLAIKIFGMTPFGWRFMGTLMGVLMVPAMYLLGKLLFKRTRFAFLAAFVMAFDMMHLTQTRIATIDSYGILFIILMYLCMFRYMQMSFFRDGWRTLIPLGLSGLFMGLGCASKWICFYAAIGLAILFFWSMVQRYLEWRAVINSGGQDTPSTGDAEGGIAGESAAPEGGDLSAEVAERVRRYPTYLLGTLGACVLFFIVIPFAIYYASYIPYFAYEGGLTFDRFWRAQIHMYNYHSTLTATHPYQSPWYEWPLMLRPMWYYNGAYKPAGTASSIMAMGNPAVWWIGFGTMLYTFWRWLRPHLRGERVADHRPALLLIGFAAQLVPWLFVTRAVFIYHYFASLIFVMLSIVYAFEQLSERRAKIARTVNTGGTASITRTMNTAWTLQLCYMALVLLLFVGFYPVATGVTVPRAWLSAMNWLGWIKLPWWTFGGWLRF